MNEFIHSFIPCQNYWLANVKKLLAVLFFSFAHCKTKETKNTFRVRINNYRFMHKIFSFNNRYFLILVKGILD